MKQYEEDEYIQLSALQHFIFCPRQCALAYLEFSWSENIYTAEGRFMHDRVHDKLNEKRGGIIRAHGLWIASKQLGLSGQADLVEFHKSNDRNTGIKLKKFQGLWLVYPVEFKRGKPKRDLSDEVQLCAQAICLEEMLNTNVWEGAIFYGRNKRRHKVEFNAGLRQVTTDISLKTHTMLKSGLTPKPVYSNKCKSCSLYDLCLPKRLGAVKSVHKYLDKIMEEII